jgi:hypothetical protein
VSTTEPPGADREPLEAEAPEGFDELLKYTLTGYAGGVVVGAFLDSIGLQRSGVGQWAVRSLAGEGESLLEGVFALRRRLSGRALGMAEAYSWGKVLGMAVPWVVDGVSRVLGVDVYGVPGFYIPFFYGMSDQIGANVSGLLFLRGNARSWHAGFAAYFRHPVMLAGLGLIVLVPAGLLAARLFGFSPSTQLLTALEAILANLCWIPPLIGWRFDRLRRAKNS